MSSYDFNLNLRPPHRPRLRLPPSSFTAPMPIASFSPSPPSSVSSSSYLPPKLIPHEEQPLSLFQQTLREKDEEFYMTFPAARLALEADSHNNPGFPTAYGFQLACASSLDDMSLQAHFDYFHISSHSLYPAAAAAAPQFPSPHGQGTDHLTHRPVELYDIRIQDTHHAAYAAPPATPLNVQHEPMATSVLHIAISGYNDSYPGKLHQQQPPSPVMDSLPSPDSSSDASGVFHSGPSPYHTSPQQAYYTPTPPDTAYDPSTLPSPVHQDPSAPSLNPPGLVQAAYDYGMDSVNSVTNIKPEPEQPQYSTEPKPPPKHEPSIPPSRRNGRHLTNRSHRRYSPQYTRPSHKSRGSGNAGPISGMGSLGWSPSPTSVRDVGAATAPTSAAAPSSSTSTLIMTRRSMSALTRISSTNGGTTGKRHSDKKPALACVFCRGRKIACGPPVKDGDGKSCNQCQRRSLRCEYPTESRRGMRKKSTTLNINPNGPVVNRKR